MNTTQNKPIIRILMLTLVFAVMFALTGAKPVPPPADLASYIVQATSTNLAVTLVTKYGGQVTTRLDIIKGVAANISTSKVAALRLEKGIIAVTPNGKVKTSDNDKSEVLSAQPGSKGNGVPVTDYPDVVGADLVWAQGVTGAGVSVAVLDTGVADVTQFSKGSKSRIVGWKDFVDKDKKPKDPNGHGTHVAGIIANGQQGGDGEWNGMAPDTNIVGVRVLDDQGAGTYETVIAGLQWVLQHKADYNIRVVNLSLVSPASAPYWADPLDQAVTAVWADGLVVVVAAGNSGPGPMSISVPGNNPYAITVGAFTDNYTPSDWNDDYIPDFSATGPTLDGFIKPDLVAPGGHIVSTTKQNSFLSSQYPDNRVKSDYFKMAGTSQAAAIVSGIAALAISKDPALTPDQFKLRITATALPWIDASQNPGIYSMWQQGAGRANAFDAVFATTAETANKGMDIQQDLAGTQHYEGYAYYDETTQSFRLYAPYDSWVNAYTSWSGGHGSWSGGHGSWSGDYGAWSGGHGSWSGGHGSWSGGHGSWSGDFLAWAGGHGSWSGGYTTWAGGHGSWSGGHGSWSGTEPWAGSQLANSAFTDSFANGVSPSAATSTATISVYLLNQ